MFFVVYNDLHVIMPEKKFRAPIQNTKLKLIYFKYNDIRKKNQQKSIPLHSIFTQKSQEIIFNYRNIIMRAMNHRLNTRFSARKHLWM